MKSRNILLASKYTDEQSEVNENIPIAWVKTHPGRALQKLQKYKICFSMYPFIFGRLSSFTFPIPKIVLLAPCTF